MGTYDINSNEGLLTLGQSLWWKGPRVNGEVECIQIPQFGHHGKKSIIGGMSKGSRVAPESYSLRPRSETKVGDLRTHR